MKLQLKKVQFSEHMSEETNAFTADVYYNGKKVGYAKNDGRGGGTWTMPYPEMRGLLAEAEAYAKTLPSIKTDYKNKDGSQFIIESDIEVQVDELFTAWLNRKELTKESNKGIYFERDGKNWTRTWKGYSIAKLKKHPSGAIAIQNALDKVVASGGKILNTNLQGFKF
jgi:hypothetical protein